MRKFKTWIFVLVITTINGCNNNTDTLKFGATFPLTGDVASYGINAKNGIQLRVDEINANGGINGQLIEVYFQDDKNSPRDAVSIFNYFATIQKYPVVFGSAGSSVTLAIVPIANKQKIVLISPISSSSQLSQKGGDYFFRTVPSDNLQAEMLADWVITDNVKKIGLIYTNNSWGKPLAEGFKEIFTNNGGEILLEEGVPENTTDFKTIILKLGELELDAVISPTYPTDGGNLVKQLKEAGINIKLYGGDNWFSPEFRDIAKSAAEGVLFTAPSESKSPNYDTFVTNYKSKFGSEPDIISAYGYDAATTVFNAIANLSDINPENIRKIMLKESFMGVSGYISFSENGDIKSDGYGKYTIENGEIINLN